MKKRSFLLLAMLIALPLVAMRSPKQITDAKSQAEQAIKANNFDRARKIIGDLRKIRQERFANQLEIQLLRKELAQSQAQVQQLQQVRAAPVAAPAAPDERQLVELQQQNAELLQANNKLSQERSALRKKMAAIKDPYEALKKSLAELQGEFATTLHQASQTHPAEVPNLEQLFQHRDTYLAQLRGVREKIEQLNEQMDRVMGQADAINKQFFPRGQ